MVSGLGPLIALAPVTALTPLLLEFKTGQKEILPRRPHFPIERANQGHQRRVFQPAIPQELSRPGPVLLLHIRIVVGVLAILG